MQKYYDVAVVFGGVSSENEVSVITGTMTCNVLKKGGTTVVPVYLAHDGVMRAGEGLADVTVFKGDGFKKYAECTFVSGGIALKKRGKFGTAIKVGCVINCCHGGAAEGGAVAGAAALCNLPFASAGTFESAALIDKYLTKIVLGGLGVTCAKYVYLQGKDGAAEKAKTLGYPLIVKPATLGSSIGICRAENEEQLLSDLDTAFALDDAVILEEYFSDRREINCAALRCEIGVVASPCEEAKSDGEILSYDDKYSGGGTRVFPAMLTKGEEKEITETTVRVYTALNMRGIVRFDYIMSGEKIYLSEINTVPGSLSQYLVSDGYADFYRVLQSVIAEARKDFARARSKRVIKTGILNNIALNTCKLK